MSSLKAPRVFITGASSGIGAALASEYATRGVTLGLSARRREFLEQLAGKLNVPTAIYPLDVRDANALRSAAQDFIHRFGPPDIVIANAGISVGALTEEAVDLPVFQEVLDINFMGMVNTFHAFLVPMRERRSGTLVGIGSVAGFRGLPGGTAYSASKAAAISYLEGLRVELRGSGVSVTTLCPGYIKTPMTAVNPYRMPFILDAEEAARRFVRVIDAKKSFAVVPWQMGLMGFLLRGLPNWIFDRAFAKAGRKPRRE